MAFLAVLARLDCTDEYVSQLGLYLWMQMHFRLFHPDGGIGWAIKGLHQRRQYLRHAKTDIRNLYLAG